MSDLKRLGKMKKLLTALVLLIVFSGCQTSNSSIIAWKPEYLQGHVLEQESDTIVNDYTFLQDGLVAATIGSRNGALAAPLWYWKIDDRGRLIIFDDEKHEQSVLLLVSKSPERIHARTPLGLDVTFKYTKK